MSVNMKCPTCGGPVYFEPKSGMMKCSYCGSVTNTEEFAKYDAERPQKPPQKNGSLVWDEKQGSYVWKLNKPLQKGVEFEKLTPEAVMQQQLLSQPPFLPEEGNPVEDGMAPAGGENTSGEEGELSLEDKYVELSLYTCTSCGAKLMVNGTEASTFCGFCGSSTIVFDRISKQLRPQKIIPFKLTEQQALDCIKERFRKAEYIPSAIRELTVDKIRGIYMPFWLYESYIRRSMRIEVPEKDKGVKKYYRDASCIYHNVTMDATLKLNNELSKRLEPFDMDELEDFNPAYLSGYYADKFDVPSDAVSEIVQNRCRTFLDDAILKSCPDVVNYNFEATQGHNYKVKDVQEEYRVNKIDYALLPAYFINIFYKKGTQTVIVNGQTGKVVGNLPVDRGQFVRSFMKAAVVCCLIFSLISIGILAWAQINTKAITLFLPLVAAVIISLVNGVHSYKRYKMDLFRMNTSLMKSYINDREEMV